MRCSSVKVSRVHHTSAYLAKPESGVLLMFVYGFQDDSHLGDEYSDDSIGDAPAGVPSERGIWLPGPTPALQVGRWALHKDCLC